MNTENLNLEEVPYVVMAPSPSKRAFVLHKISDVTDWYEVVEGESRAENFPDNVTHTIVKGYYEEEEEDEENFDPDNPAPRTILDDVIHSPNRVFLISHRVRVFFISRSVNQVEYLPCTILNSKGESLALYYILSPINPIDCLDIVASKAKASRADKDYVGAIDGIVVKSGLIDPELQIFKIKKLFEQVIIHRNLAQAIVAQGFTGIRWIEFANFKRS